MNRRGSNALLLLVVSALSVSVSWSVVCVFADGCPNNTTTPCLCPFAPAPPGQTCETGCGGGSCGSCQPVVSLEQGQFCCSDPNTNNTHFCNTQAALDICYDSFVCIDAPGGGCEADLQAGHPIDVGVTAAGNTEGTCLSN